ncbi:hypothetical protein HK101_002653 [Irineochytrium annulatum]|nr:hypothetical protein HK101_002653 [Irineochytrium annulatum]
MSSSTTPPANLSPEEIDAAKKKKNEEKNEAARAAKMAKLEAKRAKEAEAKAAKEAKEAAGGASDAKVGIFCFCGRGAAQLTAFMQKVKKPKANEDAGEAVVVDKTIPGNKKDLTTPFAAKYSPSAVESSWYAWWEKEGFFKPELTPEGKPLPAGTFTLSIPPPNVTGSLHVGHALTNSIQDTLTRWNRMLGKTTLFVPGCDHAGIATQVVVEKKIMREQKKTRHDLGREEFVKNVWAWKNQYGDSIYGQIRRLGTSVDWSRVAFTMDPGPSKAVTEAFVRLHDEGIIFRANRLVNWCTKLKTAISNLEVENMELEGRTMLSVPDHDPAKKYEFGVIISFAYKIENSKDEIVVATTRIETMLGDTAIAVHPQDERYKHLVGKYAVHPFLKRRIIIVADDYVERDFGTGAVKITPAHDLNDYAIGKRHNLEFINIFTDDGKVNENGGEFQGLQRFDARVAVLKRLKEMGFYKETKDNKMQIPICTRSNNVVEPLMKPQWWVDCKDMAAAAMEAVRSKKIEIIPEASERDWFLWLEKIQDWCISRQLWWGHRVPAYFVDVEGLAQDADSLDSEYWVSGRSEEEAMQKAKKKFPKAKKITLKQDEDVLDTWFSAGLWPFSILGWPEKTRDLEIFHPNSLLETGWDILFFWVARMVMMGIKLTGDVPFKQVFCHAMVRDAYGRKMSKSLGNVIDPLDVISGISLEALQKRLDEGNLDPKEIKKAKEGQQKDYPKGIPECGTDALRFTLLACTGERRDINLNILHVEGYRKFCNKLWNATRFALLNLGEGYVPPPYGTLLNGDESLSDLWILHKLSVAARDVNNALERRNFMQATGAAYNFWYYEFCDVFVEICKPIIEGGDEAARKTARDTLYTCLDNGLKLLHPMMPFVTEELWQRIPRRKGDPRATTIMKASFPVEEPSWTNQKADDDFEAVNKVVKASRSLLSDYGILKDGELYVQTSNETLGVILRKSAEIITSALVRPAKSLKVVSKISDVPAGCALQSISQECNVYLLVRGKVDIEAEISKCEKKKEKAVGDLEELRKRTSAADYEKKVKKEVRERDAEKV